MCQKFHLCIYGNLACKCRSEVLDGKCNSSTLKFEKTLDI